MTNIAELKTTYSRLIKGNKEANNHQGPIMLARAHTMTSVEMMIVKLNAPRDESSELTWYLKSDMFFD